MNKVLKELKKNKYTTIAIILFFLMILLGFILYNSIFPNAGKPVYGNRLDGIEQVNITDAKFKEINEKLEENKLISKATGSINGRIINYIITVPEKTKTSDAKKLTSLITKEFSKEQLKYFDVQVFIKSENESSQEKGYPIIAYKNKKATEFSFSNAK